jgi:hypothetical protein
MLAQREGTASAEGESDAPRPDASRSPQVCARLHALPSAFPGATDLEHTRTEQKLRKINGLNLSLCASGEKRAASTIISDDAENAVIALPRPPSVAPCADHGVDDASLATPLSNGASLPPTKRPDMDSLVSLFSRVKKQGML